MTTDKSSDKIFITNIENDTIQNNFYRKVLYTSNNQQLVVMNLECGEDISLEIHSLNDQFVRIEKGSGLLIIGKNGEKKYEIFSGVAFIVPANTWHRIINTSSKNKLKLYTIYSPPHHASNKIDIRQPLDDFYKTKYHKYKSKYLTLIR